MLSTLLSVSALVLPPQPALVRSAVAPQPVQQQLAGVSSVFPSSSLLADSKIDAALDATADRRNAFLNAYTAKSSREDSPAAAPTPTKAATVTSLNCPESAADSKYPLSKACSAQLNQKKQMKARDRALAQAQAERAAERQAKAEAEAAKGPPDLFGLIKL